MIRFVYAAFAAVLSVSVLVLALTPAAASPTRGDVAPEPTESGGPSSPAESFRSEGTAATSMPLAASALARRSWVNPNLFQIGAMLDATATARDEGQDRADLRALEVNLGASVDPRFDLRATLEFTPDEVALEEAYVEARLPWHLRARLGRQLLPFGTLNPIHLDAYPQVDAPRVLANFFGPEGLNSIGGTLEWQAPFAENPTLSLLVGAYNGGTGGSDATPSNAFPGTAHGGDPGFGGRPLVAGRASSFYEWGPGGRHAVRLGVSAVGDENDSFTHDRTTVAGIDAKYRWRINEGGRGLTVAGEYLRHDREQSAGNVFAPFLAGQNYHSDGWYAYGQYDLNRNWGGGYRYDDAENLFQPLQRTRSHSPYLEWRPSEFARLRLQYRHDDRNFDNNGDLAINGSDDEDLILLQGTWFIGWHPAHTF